MYLQLVASITVFIVSITVFIAGITVFIASITVFIAYIFIVSISCTVNCHIHFYFLIL